MDGDLLSAVAAKTAERGETVTDMIVSALRAYIRDDEAAGTVSAPSVSEPPVYTPVESPARYEEPPGQPACKHPAGSVDLDAGVCRECGTDVW